MCWEWLTCCFGGLVHILRAGSVYGFSGPSTPPGLIIRTKCFWPWLFSIGSCPSCTRGGFWPIIRSSPGTVMQGKGANLCSATDGPNGRVFASRSLGSFNLICQGPGWFTTYLSSLANLNQGNHHSFRQQQQQPTKQTGMWLSGPQGTQYLKGFIRLTF